MQWKMLVVAMLAAGGVAVEAGASSLGNPPEARLEEASALASPAAVPAPADLVLPPHLTGGLSDSLRWTPGGQALPTLQDLVVASPTYVAPPPTRHRSRHHGGRRH